MLRYKSASVRVAEFDDYISLTCLQSEECGKGHATILLSCIKKYAKKKSKSVILTCVPYGKNAMSYGRTLRFYEDRGFTPVTRPDCNAHMVYEPKGLMK